jgi:hypothetical protein
VPTSIVSSKTRGTILFIKTPEKSEKTASLSSLARKTWQL